METTCAGPGDDADRDPIEALAESFLERFRRGERPSVEEYAAEHPELADEIRELLPALGELERDQSVGGEATVPGPAGPRAATLRGRRGSSATTRSSARSAGAAWASSTRPCSSRSAATWR